MGRKPVSGLVGLLLVGGLLTGCNKSCRQGCWGGKSVQDTPPVFGSVGGPGGGESWDQDPRRNTAVGQGQPMSNRRPGAAVPVGGEVPISRMPAAPSHGPTGMDTPSVGGQPVSKGSGLQPIGFESEPRRMLPPAPSPEAGVNTETRRPHYEGGEMEGTPVPSAQADDQPPKLNFPPPPVSGTDEESATEAGQDEPPPPPPPAAGPEVDIPPPPEPVNGSSRPIHSIPGGTGEPGPLPPPPPYPPGN